MSDSILTSVKKLLGITEEYEYFDPDIITDINSVFMILHQMGVGSKEVFTIEDKSATWSDFLGEAGDIEAVKTYVALKVRLMFDPPASAQHKNAIDENIKELEFRLYSAPSSKNFEVEEGDTYGYGSSSSLMGSRSIRYRIWADDEY